MRAIVDPKDIVRRLNNVDRSHGQRNLFDRADAAREIDALREIVRKLVIEPADTIGPAFVCAAWLDATETESAAIQRALDSGRSAT